MRPRSFRCPALVLALACAGAPGSIARAEPPPPTAGARSMEAVKQADVLFQKGNRLYADKKWGEAEAAFAAAWALNPSFDVASNLGAAQFQLGKYRDAAEHLAFALRQWPLIGGPTRRQIALDRLRECRKHVGALGIRASTAHVEVQVDGHAVGATPLDLEVFVEPGRHVVEGRLEGYEAARQDVDATAGAGMTVTLAMVATPAVPAVQAPAKEEVGAVVKKEEVPVPPPVPPTLPVKEGGWKPGLPVLVTGGALAVVGLAVGVGLTVAANGKSADATAMRAGLGGQPMTCTPGLSTASSPSCGTLKSTLTAESTLSSAAVGSFVAGGACALITAGLGLWRFRTPSDQKVAVRVVPEVAPDHASVILFGRW
jgi:hypothetical protein